MLRENPFLWCPRGEWRMLSNPLRNRLFWEDSWGSYRGVPLGSPSWGQVLPSCEACGQLLAPQGWPQPPSLLDWDHSLQGATTPEGAQTLLSCGRHWQAIFRAAQQACWALLDARIAACLLLPKTAFPIPLHRCRSLISLLLPKLHLSMSFRRTLLWHSAWFTQTELTTLNFLPVVFFF